MATENTANNNSAGSNSSDDLSYKSQNIIGSKSRNKTPREFAADKPKFSDRVKTSFDKLQSINTKNLNLILATVIVLVGAGIGFGVVTIINRNIATEEAAEEAEAAESDGIDALNSRVDVSDEDINSVETNLDNIEQEIQAEVESILNDGSKSAEDAGKVYADRFNQYAKEGDADIAADILATGSDYFSEHNLPRAALAMYLGIDSQYYDMVEPGELGFYTNIIELAKTVGDNSTKDKYQQLYDQAFRDYDETGEEE